VLYKIYVYFIYIKLHALYILYICINICKIKYTHKIYISQTAKYHTHTHTLVLTKTKFVQEIIDNAIKIKTNFFLIII